MRKRHRRRDMSPKLERKIEDQHRAGYGPKEIFDMMAGWAEYDPDREVAYKTVQRVCTAEDKRDSSGPWSVADRHEETGFFMYSPEECETILDVYAAVVLTYERKTAFTKNEAAWVLRVAKMLPLPELDRYRLWEIARSYMRAENREESTRELDAYLAFKPWRNRNRHENYGYALRQGWIKPVPGVVFEQAYEGEESTGGPTTAEQTRERHRTEIEDLDLSRRVKAEWEAAWERRKLMEESSPDKATVYDNYNRMMKPSEKGRNKRKGR